MVWERVRWPAVSSTTCQAARRHCEKVKAARMDLTYLGRTGLQVSRLCLGTMNFGPRTSEEDAHVIMDVAHEAGINFFDTANRYGSEPGETETIIGNWFARGGGRQRTSLPPRSMARWGVGQTSASCQR
jgi:hypothetical protein